MFIEYACHDEVDYDILRTNVFSAIEMGVNGISVPATFMGKVRGFLPEGISVSCPIDFPNGLQSTKQRNHAIIEASRHRANAVDLLVQQAFWYNCELDRFKEDIQSNLKICEHKGITMRVVVDYRKSNSREDYQAAFRTLKSYGVEYAMVSTGYHVDNAINNLIMCKTIGKNSGLSMITNGNIYLDKHWDAISRSEIFGVRFHHIKALERCLAGV